MKRAIIGVALLVAHSSPARTLKTVKLGILEGLASTDSTSSERYRQRFDAATYFAIGESEKALNRCGYKLQVIPAYYEASDQNAPKASAELLEREGAWIIFGPRRSEDFKFAAQGLRRTAFVSPMANDLSMSHPPALLYSMYPSVEEFGNAAVSALEREKLGKRYAAVVDATCPACRDFEAIFDSLSKRKGYKKLFSVDIAGDKPESFESYFISTFNSD